MICEKNIPIWPSLEPLINFSETTATEGKQLIREGSNILFTFSVLVTLLIISHGTNVAPVAKVCLFTMHVTYNACPTHISGGGVTLVSLKGRKDS